MHDVLLNLAPIATTKWWLSSHQVTAHGAKTPPIACDAVARAKVRQVRSSNQLRCHVFDSADAETVAATAARSADILHSGLAETEMREEKMAITIQETILRLQITVDNTYLSMQEIQGQHNFCHVESSNLFREELFKL